MGKRTGGVAIEAKRNIIQDNDVYFHPVVAKEMLTYLKPHYAHMYRGRVLDACCNEGILGNTLKEMHPDLMLHFNDIKNHDGISIMDYEPPFYVKDGFDIIICNPPWVPVELPEKIYHKLLTMLAPDGVLFFIINNTFAYQGIDRAVKLEMHKVYFMPRFSFKSEGRDLLDCCVIVHDNGDMSPDAIKLNSFIPVSRLDQNEQLLFKDDKAYKKLQFKGEDHVQYQELF